MTYDFKTLSSELVLDILKPEIGEDCSASALARSVSLYDLKRLEDFGKKKINYKLILDLFPTLTDLWFTKQLNI